MRPTDAAIFLAALAFAGPAWADAWTQARGEGQVIVKFERMRAVDGFDPDGVRLPLPAARTDTAVRVFAEYGLTDRLTFQFKTDWQSGRDAFVDYSGRGPIEVGVNWQVLRTSNTAVSLYAGVADGGEGRNAGYALPGVGDRDWEARLSVGRSLMDGRVFVEAQGARRLREGLPDEVRIDLTAGMHHGEWMWLSQAFAGSADGGARWLSLESSVTRGFGRWRAQAGWRTTVHGRETPVSSGPVIGLWRRF